jgi:hypothetical protein
MADTTLRIRWPTGATLYTQIEDGTGVWNGTAYASFAVASWATFATATPETPASSGRYVCQFPIASAAGNYTWSTYLRAGGSPASTDVCIGNGGGYWDGTTFGGASSVSGAVASVSGAVGSVTGNVGGNVVGSVASVTAAVNANVIRSGTAQAGSATSITLDSGASSTADLYANCTIVLTGGTGAGQSGFITAYNGTTKVATVSSAWATNPASGTAFNILPQGAVSVATLPAVAPFGYGPIGTGSVAVNEDYPTDGNLAYRVTSTGPGIGGAYVRAYLASEYTLNPTTATIRGQTLTLASGAWANNMDLDPGNYVVVFKAEGYELLVVDLTVE